MNPPSPALWSYQGRRVYDPALYLVAGRRRSAMRFERDTAQARELHANGLEPIRDWHTHGSVRSPAKVTREAGHPQHRHHTIGGLIRFLKGPGARTQK
jgi:hypothetical protein